MTKGNEEIRRVFGKMLWTVADGSPFGHTVRELVSRGQRVIIENNKDSWLSPSVGQPIVFYPTVSILMNYCLNVESAISYCSVFML